MKIKNSYIMLGFALALALIASSGITSAQVFPTSITTANTLPINDGKIYPNITIRDWCIPFTEICFSGDNAYVDLLENSPSCSGDCVAMGRAVLNKEGMSLIDNVKFYTLNLDKDGREVSRVLQPIRSYRIYYSYGRSEKEVDDYGRNCVKSGKINVTSGTEDTICSQVKIGSHKEYVYAWQNYNEGDSMPSGEYYFKIEGEKKANRIVDWVISSNGVEIGEWATWGASSLSQDNRIYLKLDESTGTTYYDSIGNANFSILGATIINSTGKINKSALFNNIALGYSWLYSKTPTFSGNNFTITGWFNASDDSADPMLFSHDGSNYVQYYPNINQLDWFANGVDFKLLTGIGLNSWHFIALLKNSTSTCMYIDGLTTINCTAATTAVFQGILNIGIYINNQSNGWTGQIDEIGYWNRSLTNAEITQLYNSGNGQTYPFLSNTVTLNSPADNLISPSSNMTFNCSASVSGATLINISLWTNSTGVWTVNQTVASSGNSDTVSFTALNSSDTKFLWTCRACDSDGDCGVASANRTLEIHTTAPVVTIYSPIGTLPYTPVNSNLTLNFTVIELHPDLCWFNYNNTNTFIPCTANYSFGTTSQRNLTLYANDSAGNIGSAFTTWTFNYIEDERYVNPSTIVGSSERYALNVSTNKTIVYSDLVWNGTAKSTAINYLGTNANGYGYNIKSSFNIPVIKSSNVSLYWRIQFADGSWTNSTSSTQQVINITMDNCAAGSTLLINYTYKGELSKAPLNVTIENTTVQVNAVIYSADRTLIAANYSEYRNVNPVQVCINTNLSNSTLSLDAVARYYATNYVAEFHNMQNVTLTESNVPQLIDLFGLPITDSQEFQISYRDSNYIPVPNVLIDIQRYYVEDGIYRTVEIPLTDSSGLTLAHFDLNNVRYNIVVSKFGKILAVFNNIIPFCDNIATGDCTINLYQPGQQIAEIDWTQNDGLHHTETCNKTSRTVTLQFSTADGSAALVSMNSTKFDMFSNDTVCSNSLYSSSGTISCSVPPSYGNVTIVTDIYKDGELVSTFFCNITNAAGFGVTGIILAIILIVTMGFMFISSKIGVIIGTIIGLIMAILLGLYSNSVFIGLTSSIAWVIISGVILIWKVSKRGEE